MATSLNEMTKEELIQLIETVIDRKLLEMFDVDDEIELKPDVKARLIRQRVAVAQGERGTSFNDVMRQLDLD